MSPLSKTPSGKTKYEEVATELRRRIADGRYRDGRLPSQRVLADAFGVSRNTLLSALALLEKDGWIESHDRRRAHLLAPEHVFTRKLSAFLQESGFRPPLMNSALEGRNTVLRAAEDAIDLSLLCHEHWDEHLNYDLEEAAVQAALRRFRQGETNIYRTAGIPQLKEALCAHLEHFGIAARPSEIFIVSRRLQAYRLVAEVLLGQGAELWIPELSLSRFYGVAERHTARRRFLSVSVTGEIDFEPALFSKRPKMLFLEPTHAKPTGATIPETERERLVEAARRSSTFLFEDAYCRLLEGEAPATLASFDPQKEAVIHLGAVPTWLTPLGGFSFLLAHERVIELLRASARRDYLNPEFLTQLTAVELLRSGGLAEMLRRFHAFHRERRRFVDKVLTERLGELARWSPEQSFGCLWLELPTLDVERLYRRRRDVDFQPGWLYGEPKRACRHVLLRYTMPAADFEEGVARFARLCRSAEPSFGK